MKCPKCGSDTQVINTRPTAGGETRRRRECWECDYRFTTYELEKRVVPATAAEPYSDEVMHALLVVRPRTLAGLAGFFEESEQFLSKKLKDLESAGRVRRSLLPNARAYMYYISEEL